MKIKTYQVYNDPSHGWIKVPKADLRKLGIADKVSQYSYQRGEFAYLEEDADATLFVEALYAAGLQLKLKNNYSDKSSKIRSYDTYEYLTDEQETELADLKSRMIDSRHWNRAAIRRIENAGLAALKHWTFTYGF